jgi:hypothetical protein
VSPLACAKSATMPAFCSVVIAISKPSLNDATQPRFDRANAS